MLSERGHTQKATHCMILFTWWSGDLKQQDRKSVVGCQGYDYTWAPGKFWS